MNIKFSCQKINTDNLKFTIINNRFYKGPLIDFYKSNLNLLGYIKIDGLTNKLKSLCSLDSSCTDSDLCDNCFSIRLTDTELALLINSNPKQLVGTYKRTFIINDKEFSFDISSIFQSKKGIDFKGFNFIPDLLTFNINGGALPLYTFTLDSNPSENLYISHTNDYNFETPNAAYYTSTGKTIYVGKIKPTSIVPNTMTFNFYSQNNTFLDNLNSRTLTFNAYGITHLSNCMLDLMISSYPIPYQYVPIKVKNEIQSGYEFYDLFTKFKDYSIATQFPYGMESCIKSVCTYASTHLVWGSSRIGKILVQIVVGIFAPQINILESTHLYDSTFLYKTTLTNSSVSINLFGEIFRSDKLVSVESGVFEFVKDLSKSTTNKLIISSNFDFDNIAEYNTFFSVYSPTLLTSPMKTIKNIFSINLITFSDKTVNITNKSVSNKMFIGFSETVDKDTVFSLIINDDPKKDYKNPKNHFFARWNNDLGLFEINFIIKANSIQTGYLPYIIYYDYLNSYSVSNSLFQSDFQLNVTSKLFDNRGPIFSSVSNETGSWTLEIEDLVNGFDEGYVLIVGEVDYSVYNYTLNSSNRKKGDQFIGTYLIKIPSFINCSTQKFYIKKVFLKDNQGYTSYYNKNGDIDPLSNPLAKYMAQEVVATSICSKNFDTDDTTPPLLGYFDARLKENTITFQFQYTDGESGINQYQLPVVYLKNLNQRIESCISRNLTSNFGVVPYSCTLEIPRDFGPFTVSVYGALNNAGLSVGCSEDCLEKLTGAFPYYEPGISLLPAITSTNLFSNMDTTLWINGFQLTNIISASVKYESQDNKTYTADILSSYNCTASIGIKSTDKPIYITIINSYGVSNEYKAVPTHLFNFGEPLPTNAPQKCTNDCSGSTKGYCSDKGCVCYSPWIGEDCSSQIIVVPPPKVNTTNPSTEIIVNNNQFFKSLVSIVSIRELNVSNSIVEQYYFEKWTHTNVSESVNKYTNNITTSSNVTFSVTITLEWFTNKTNVTFANQEIFMNPSTMKYTIHIGQYPFKSQLNSLQIVMSASIETDSQSNMCSSQQFGETSSGDNSDYIKIQIDNHSLYGRLIKRGILDYKIRSLSNEFQLHDDRYNGLPTSNTQYQSQSLIGINLAYFTEFALIDPDFSVIIDHSSANSNSPNSICKKSGLTKSQIAGIAVGGAVFLIVVLIIVGSIIYRSQYCLPVKIIIYKIFKKSKV
ncbi:hypothetical protein DICPUDRAFT_78589 [Dictyostelium purpureum]|uniref:EGF-like domain-containing protein n=1 Tax=Dictyostelium purpureum TaxID=5786 RepID=F0ZK01_DICPU|nr:uncharacterized protein DICPUDRAFT_78589 [Dictyostelium purpureum]EGC35736.1 hypothetical protein DICPUDRAFT_78589 [Dictyostelium purpureum]|eukprot:XP_003287739.1 hypothetical protein DICPUDRAFT_78589 [Dictyostelium purpureum]